MAGLDTRTSQRTGVTLIELLVVISLIVVLATLAVAFVPSFRERQNASNGAGQVQGWLSVSREWALRDQAPRGVRLAPSVLGLVTVLEYIEQPDDFSGGSLINLTTDATGNGTVNATAGSVDFLGGFPANDPSAPVQTNDMLEVPSASSQLFKITAVPSSTQLTIRGSPNLNYPTILVTDYRIVRQARPRTGEGPLQLPPNVAIDLQPNGIPPFPPTAPTPWYGNPLTINNSNVNAPYGAIDILFAPSGEVIQGAGSQGMIQLWVRETTDDWNNKVYNGNQTLVTVYRRTGMISTQPVDLTSTIVANQYDHPYSFTQNGQASGM